MHPTCETAVGWASDAHGCAREAPPKTMVKHCCVLMYHFVKYCTLYIVHCTTMTPHCTIEPPPSDNPVLLSIRRDRVWETEVSQNPIRFKYRKNSQIWSRFCDHLPLLWPQGKSCSSGRSLVISSLFCLSPPPDRRSSLFYISRF